MYDVYNSFTDQKLCCNSCIFSFKTKTRNEVSLEMLDKEAYEDFLKVVVFKIRDRGLIELMKKYNGFRIDTTVFLTWVKRPSWL